jgi:hypothetical protein
MVALAILFLVETGFEFAVLIGPRGRGAFEDEVAAGYSIVAFYYCLVFETVSGFLCVLLEAGGRLALTFFAISFLVHVQVPLLGSLLDDGIA